MKIRNILFPLFIATLFIAASCSSRKGLEGMAMERLPKALEKAMEDQMSLKGGAKIQSLETIYVCDSLCMIQFQAAAKDPSGKEFSFPVRYVLLHDVFLSAAKGHQVYLEMVTGCQEMNRKELKTLKESCREKGNDLYVYYAGVASPINPEDLW
jgi:hypothetical protein